MSQLNSETTIVHRSNALSNVNHSEEGCSIVLYGQSAGVKRSVSHRVPTPAKEAGINRNAALAALIGRYGLGAPPVHQPFTSAGVDVSVLLVQEQRRHICTCSRGQHIRDTACDSPDAMADGQMREEVRLRGNRVGAGP